MTVECEIQGCTEAATKRCMCNKHYKRWWRYGDAETVFVGKKASKGRWIVNGYWYIKVDGKLIAEHRHLAEKALGKPLPYGAEVHHLDENKLNNAPSNLVVCPNHEYHVLLHDRARAYAHNKHR